MGTFYSLYLSEGWDETTAAPDSVVEGLLEMIEDFDIGSNKEGKKLHTELMALPPMSAQ